MQNMYGTTVPSRRLVDIKERLLPHLKKIELQDSSVSYFGITVWFMNGKENKK
jgi:hypothetical protein